MSTQTVKALLIAKTAEGKSKTQTFTNVNPQAEEANVAEALQKFSTLQKHTVKEYQRVVTTTITP